jgi:glyoxylase-like metal-dependent hydrolase (beta-lactamase superfamily II)
VVLNRDFRSNTYLVKTPCDGDDGSSAGTGCVVVDPGLDHEALEAELAACAWRPIAVVCTHGHFDHVGGAAWLQQRYGIPVYLPESDLKTARLSNFLLAALKLNRRIELPAFSLVPTGAAPIELGGLSFTFHPLPGHTPGSCALALGDLLFSGDSLYAHQTALSRMPGEDHALLRRSLRGLFSWVEPTVRVLPGHGSSATVAEILEHNLALREFMAAEPELAA